MKRSVLKGLGIGIAAVLALAACGGSPTAASSSTGPVSLTMAGWSLSTTPEFKTLADAFHAQHPNITIKLKQYDATNYDTQLTADLAAGTAPDIYVLKNLQDFITYQAGGQLMDVSDVAKKYAGDGKLGGLSSYKVDKTYYAIPYRQDSWFMFYNKDLFKKAKVAYPDGTWTWDDFATKSQALTTGLKAAGSDALGTYLHTWQSVVQGFAQAQTPKADLLSGNYSYLKPYYERALKLQADGATVKYGTATTNSLTYQSQFGKQKAATMLMGSWYAATLIAQVKSGDADNFSWGIAPAPQYSSSTTGDPVTFGDPTGLGINAKIENAKITAAKEFLDFAGSQGAAIKLASIGITPAYSSAAVTKTFFGVKGMPGDVLSKTTFSTHVTKPENPVSKNTEAIQSVLNDEHSSIMSGSTSVDHAISDAASRVKSEVLNK